MFATITPALLLDRQASALKTQLNGVYDGDVDAVHDARVATRRIRELLTLIPIIPGREGEEDITAGDKRIGQALGLRASSWNTWPHATDTAHRPWLLEARSRSLVRPLPVSPWRAAAVPSPSGLSTLKKDQIAERGARMAGRDNREYREYLRAEQRSQPGCPAREVVLVQRGQAARSGVSGRAVTPPSIAALLARAVSVPERRADRLLGEHRV